MTELQALANSIAHELTFWKGFVKTDRFLSGWVKNIPTPELRVQVRDFIWANLPKGGKVLDVGSGVVSILNGTVPNHLLTAADPLGNLYSIIFDYKKHGLRQPDPIAGEMLSDFYKQEFDIVHMSNALDHSQEPIFCISNLIDCCKKDGHVIIQGFENEAIAEDWQGFHQFNITVDENGVFEISDKEAGREIDPVKMGWIRSMSCEKIITETGKSWFIWIGKK